MMALVKLNVNYYYYYYYYYFELNNRALRTSPCDIGYNSGVAGEHAE